MIGRSKFTRKTSASFLLAIFLATGTFGFGILNPQDAQAQLGVPQVVTNPMTDPLQVTYLPQSAVNLNISAIADTKDVAETVKKSAWEVIRISLTNTAAVAVLNGLNYFAQKVAYDTAVYVSSGGKGQMPLIFDTPGAYFETVAKDAAGEVLNTLTKDPNTFGKYGVNLCMPTLPSTALKIKLGLDASLLGFGVSGGSGGSGPTSKCSWDSISNNWEAFTSQSSAEVLNNVGVMFSPGESSLSAAITVNNVVLKKINTAKYVAAIEQEIGDGFKPVVDKIAGTLKTPASTVKDTFEYSLKEGYKVKDNTATITAGAFGAGALGVVTASLQTFTGTLLNNLTKKVFEFGFVSVSDMLGLNDGEDTAFTFDGAPPLTGRRAAELANASLLTPKILSVSNYNELLEFASCPDESRTSSNCVIDQKFFGALSRVEQGVTVTLRQAIQQGYISRNWQLLPLAHQKNLEGTCYNQAFCYSNLVKLRRARIIPAGWEIAANSVFNDISRPATLGEVMDRFNDCPMTVGPNPVVDEARLPDPLHPWCHLIDPEWVLKYPAASCRQRGPGPTLVSQQSSARSQVCVDVATCVAEDSSGNCIGGYGYCVREKSVWKLDADACPAQYASCTTYQRAGGGSFSYLSNTLDGADCNSQNAGCRRYGLSANSVPNSGFEDALGDEPRDWEISNDVVYHRGGRLSARGSSALGLGEASRSQVNIGGLIPGTSYRLSGSVLQELENSTAIGTIKLSLRNASGAAVSPSTLTTTCVSVAGGTAVDLDVTAIGLGYLSGSCEVTLPVDAVAAVITLSTDTDPNNRTWFDEIGLFGGSFSTSPYDSIFMNSKAEKCSSDQVGCNQFIRLSTGTLNLLRNPSFETAEGDTPAFWTGSQASRYENGTLLGHDGVSAYALSNNAIRQVVDSVTADASYSFSAYSRRDGAGQTTGTAEIQLYDSSRPPQRVSPVSHDGCDLVGSAIVVDLSAGSDYALADCQFTTPEEAGSAVVTLSAGANAPRILVDALQLELSVNSTAYHTGYSPSAERIFLKKAPEGLNCDGANPPAECQRYAPSCQREEVGCDLYRPTDGGSSIPAVTTDGDFCPAECSGYETFRQEPSSFSDAKFPLFLIPKTAQSCTASEAGCSEFTNIERLAAGGEAREYYSYLRLCAQPGPQSAPYYTWEGNENRGDGIQLRSWSLLKSNIVNAPVGISDPTGGNAPCTKLAYDVAGLPVCADNAASIVAASCSKGLVGLNPDCREFYDSVGNIHYRLYSKTVVSTNDCKEYRITTTTEAECGSHGGFWRNGECRYRSYAAESVSCRAEASGCRAYSGNASRNVRIVFTNTLESGTTDGWSAPAGAPPGDVSNSNESVAASGHSLKIERADAQKNVSNSIKIGNQYILTFWAKGTGDLSARLSSAAASSFTFDRVSGIEKPVSLTTEWRPYQIGPVEAVNAPAADERLIFQRQGNGDPLVYLDNIELREVKENIFLIADSWETPVSCDETPLGDTSPQYMLGCRSYVGRDNTTKNLKSFEKLCRPEAVGCEALYDTRNTESPFAQTWNAVCSLPDGPDAGTAPDVCANGTCPCAVAGKNVCSVIVGSSSCLFNSDREVPTENVSLAGDTVRVGADAIAYLVNDSRYRCEASNMGCTEVGERTMRPDRLAVQSWSKKTLKNLPGSYSTTLCQESEEFCQAYTRRADGASVYFKDPDTRICEFREATTLASNGVNGNGWFRKGSNEPCDPGYLEAGTRFGIWKNSDLDYQGWAGACDNRYDMCKEFIDPEDRSAGNEGGKPYYAILNERLDTRSCQGRASLRQSPAGSNDASACVMFWRTDDLQKIYDAKATYDKSEAANGALVSAVSTNDDTANVIIKVKRDRQCGEWLDCRSSETIFNQSSGQYQSVCTAFSLCAEYERVGNSTRCIRYVESSHTGEVLSPKAYASRDVSWEGMDYSGYGIPNRYPVEELVTVDVGPPAQPGQERIPDLRLVRSTGSCAEQYGQPCGPIGNQGTCLGPTAKSCVYPIDGGRPVTTAAELSQPQNATGYPPASCRIYPQETAPFPSAVADPNGWDNTASDFNNGNPVLIGPSPAFSAANVCQRRLVNGVEVSSCECNYVIASYGGTTKYLPAAGADLPQGYCTNGSFEGYECDPAASGARSRSNLSCCSANTTSSIFGDSGGCDDGSKCSVLTKVDRVVGYEGQCLERDYTTPINGRKDEFACVTWRPVNLIGGSRDIYNQNQTAGYFAPADRRFYCVGNKDAWTMTFNIDPSKSILEQPINQFFGEGVYNNRVDNYSSNNDPGAGNCSHDADGAGSTRWCIYPSVSKEKDIAKNGAAPNMQWVIDSNPIGILGCYEVSDPNNEALAASSIGPAEIVWPYIGPAIYRDQLDSIFFQVSDDIYHFDIDSEDGPADGIAYLNGEDDDIAQCDGDCNIYDRTPPKRHSSNTSAHKIIIPQSATVNNKPDYSLIPTNPNQDVFADCNNDGPDNIDSSNDDASDSTPFNDTDIRNKVVGKRGLYFIDEKNRWQVDASDSEGKIGFNARFDLNGRLKDIVLLAEADMGQNGEGTFGINAMGFSFKSGCDQVARVDVPGEYGLTKAYTNTLNPVRNFSRTAGEQFQDVFPYLFTSYSQACSAYGSIGTISSNPPTKPWTYVAATPRYRTTVQDGVESSVPDETGIEKPLQCTTLSARTATRYQYNAGNETIWRIYRKITGLWRYSEIANKTLLLVDRLPMAGSFTVVRKVEQIYEQLNAIFDETGDMASAETVDNGGVVPPRVASVDAASCDSNGRCGIGRTGSISLNGAQQGLLLGTDGSMNISAQFFAWASHNAMPIIRRTVIWGDFTPSEPPAKGWYKNQKPFCSPDVSDANSVGECANNPGLTCNVSADCPNAVACNHGVNSFGNTPGACSPSPYKFDHTYVCSLATLDAMSECLGPNGAASNAPCYRMISNSPVCVFRPKVQIVDNWGWCNCTGANCRVPGGAYSSDDNAVRGCDLRNPAPDARPWTEFDGEIRLAPTFRDAQAFVPGGGGGPVVGDGGTAVDDFFVTNGTNGGHSIFQSQLANQKVLFNDTTSGPRETRLLQVIDQPSRGILVNTCDPTGCYKLTPDGGLNYVAELGFHGNDTFTYKIVQAGFSSNVATVTIHIP